jgi:hypothetical protein
MSIAARIALAAAAAFAVAQTAALAAEKPLPRPAVVRAAPAAEKALPRVRAAPARPAPAVARPVRPDEPPARLVAQCMHLGCPGFFLVGVQ